MNIQILNATLLLGTVIILLASSARADQLCSQNCQTYPNGAQYCTQVCTDN